MPRGKKKVDVAVSPPKTSNVIERGIKKDRVESRMKDGWKIAKDQPDTWVRGDLVLMTKKV